MRALVLGLSVTGAVGCAPKTTVPIGSHAYPRADATAADQPRALLVLLPGRGDEGKDFERSGFIGALERSDFVVDVVAVDAHFGYYQKRSLPERLHEDLLAPARDVYDEIWLLGVSMGGIGALLTAERYPSEVDGVILIAPYLGRRRTLAAIEKAGGVRKWQPPEHPAWDEGVWAWIKRTDKPIYLAYGTEDFGARAHEILAQALPSDHVFTRTGVHTWTTWRPLFESLLAAGPATGPRAHSESVAQASSRPAKK